MKLLARIICKGASLEVSQVQSEFGGAHSSSAAHGNLMPCRPDTLMALRTYFFEGHAAVLFCSQQNPSLKDSELASKLQWICK